MSSAQRATEGSRDPSSAPGYQLDASGNIANVQCGEVLCPMTPEFREEYLRGDARRQALLSSVNPVKMQTCQFLINYHERRGDKIVVFCDDVSALMAYAVKLQKPYITGQIPQQEKMRILDYFRRSRTVKTIFVSRIADTSIEVPEATCLIQLSGRFGSEKEEAEKLGRILRARQRNADRLSAYYYSIVTQDTVEVHYSTRRKVHLVEEGYAVKVLAELQGMQQMADPVYRLLAEQIELLQSLLLLE